MYGTRGYARIFPREAPSEDYEHCTQPMYTAQMRRVPRGGRRGQAAAADRRGRARRDAGGRGGGRGRPLRSARTFSTPALHSGARARFRPRCTAAGRGIVRDERVRDRERAGARGRCRAPHAARVLPEGDTSGSPAPTWGATRRRAVRAPCSLDGESVKCCTMLAAQADGREVTTIEAMADGDTLHPLQDAFHRNHGLQCGYCTPGMVMAAASYLKENPSPTEEEVRESLEGNLCRCTGYQNIVKSILDAAGSMSGAQRLRGGSTWSRPRSTSVSPVLRKEDAKLLHGQGTFVDNQTMAGMVWMKLVRPPYVHATIDSIDAAVAASMPGVVGVLHRGRPRGCVPRWTADGVADHRGHQGADPLAAHEGQASDSLATPSRSSSPRPRGQAEDAAEAVVVNATELPVVTRPGGGGEGRGRAARRPRHERRSCTGGTAGPATSRSSSLRRSSCRSATRSPA